MTPAQKAWLKLLALAIGTGSVVTITTYKGGCELWVAILAGCGTACTNIYHALSDAPTDAQQPTVPS